MRTPRCSTLIPLLGALALVGCPETAQCAPGTTRLGGACVAPADAGTDGGTDAGACPSGCAAPTPICSASLRRCAECETNAECSTAAESRCDDATGECAPCAGESDCMRLVATPHCDTAVSPSQCVACLPSAGNTHCTSVTASRCVGGACQMCDMHADCSHLTATPYCDGGTCVACTPANEAVTCDTNACGPDGLCTATPRRTLTACRPCVADSECVADHACVPMELAGVPRAGRYCLPLSGGGGCVTRPYTRAVMRTSTASTEERMFCAIAEALTTCEAVLAMLDGRTCTGPSMCAAEGAECGMVFGTPGRCTYRCGVDLDCLAGVSCGRLSGTCGGT